MITVAAPAKINLYLHVIGLPNDGYHLLDSLVAFADVGDEICVDVGRDLSLEIIGPFAYDLKMCKENSIIKAALLLASSAGIDAQAAIRLTKNLPVASGIGGGSMDAAATLTATGRSVRVVSMPCMEDFAAQDDAYRASVLPSDVPTVSIEAGVTFGWDRWADRCLGIDRFGASAPGDRVMAELGITPEALVATADDLLST